jgi:uroporphyrinogen-III decarboxylase
MPVIFHSDGNFLGLVPLLLKAGVRALNPLETDCGFNLEYMKREYGADAVLFGNIETEILQKDRHDIELTLSRRLETAKKGGGFIYHGDKPVPPGIDFHNYEFALEMVQKHGRY